MLSVAHCPPAHPHFLCGTDVDLGAAALAEPLLTAVPASAKRAASPSEDPFSKRARTDVPEVVAEEDFDEVVEEDEVADISC